MTLAAPPSTRASFTTRLSNQPYTLLILMALFWASNIVLARYIVDYVPPFALTFIRWSGTFLLLLPFAWPHMRKDWPVLRQHVPKLILMALLGFTGNNGFAYWGLQHTQALNGLLIQSAGPLFVALWMLILFGVRLTTAQALGILLSMCGVLVIILHGNLTSLANLEFNLGDLGVLIGLILLGFYSALVPNGPPIHALSMMTVVTGCAAVMAIPLVAWEVSVGKVLKFDTFTVLTSAYMVIFPSAIAYTFYFRGIELIGPNRAAPFFHLIPVFGSVMAIGLLGEHLQPFHLVGYALVLAGVFIAARKKSAKSLSPSGL